MRVSETEPTRRSSPSRHGGELIWTRSISGWERGRLGDATHPSVELVDTQRRADVDKLNQRMRASAARKATHLLVEPVETRQ